MKGLLVKDFYLLFQRKQTIFLFLAISIVMGISTDGSFILGYLSFLSVLIALSTISYDDADNGMMFLMTLPVSRKCYALSKYVFGILFGIAVWAGAIVLMLVMNVLKGIPGSASENIVSALVFLTIPVILLDLMIPLQLKFGPEKSRIVILVICGGIAACGVVVSKNVKIMARAAALAEQLDRVGDIWYLFVAVIIVAVLTFLSISASVHVMEKKTF